jgi:hypothetical protein
MQNPDGITQNKCLMKTISNMIGYLTALSIAIYVVLKFGYFEGAMTFMIITGVLLGIYFPLLILDKMSETSEGKSLPVNIVGAFCASLINFAVLFKFQHWPFSGVLFTAGLACFSLLFVPMLFKQKSKQPGTNNLMNGAGAIGIATFSLGALFKMQHWPGAITLFIISPVLIFLVYFPLYMKNSSIPSEKKVKHLRDTFFVIIFVYLLFLFVFGTVMHWKVTKDYAETEIKMP